MKYYHYLFAGFIIVFAGCSTQKNASKNKMPEWITNQLSNKNYYQGVGYAQKVKKSTTHYDLAKEMALRNLAEEISVDITSSTILNVLLASSSTYLGVEVLNFGFIL